MALAHGAMPLEAWFLFINFSHSPSSIFKNIYLIKFMSWKLRNIRREGKKGKNSPFIPFFSAAIPELGDLAELSGYAMQ
jgi:hypothetical protein